jgi:hypothetical protein
MPSNTQKIAVGGGIAYLLYLYLINKTFGAGTIPGGGAGNTNDPDIATSPAKLNQIIKKLEASPGQGLKKIPVSGLRVQIPLNEQITTGVVTTANGATNTNIVLFQGTGLSYRIANIYFQAAGAILIVETKPVCALENIVTPSGMTTGQVCDIFKFQLTGSQRGYIKN